MSSAKTPQITENKRESGASTRKTASRKPAAKTKQAERKPRDAAQKKPPVIYGFNCRVFRGLSRRRRELTGLYTSRYASGAASESNCDSRSVLKRLCANCARAS